MKKFLLIQTAFLGDVVLATALIEKLRQTYPEATIDFLLRKGNESLLEGHPHLRRVLIFNKKEKLKSLRQLIRTIRAERYDWVINAHRFFTSGLITVASGARQTAGYGKNPLSFLFSRSVPHRIGEGHPPPHEVERNHQLIAPFTDEKAVNPRLYPPAAAYDKVPNGEDYVCIAPTSVWFTKQWPAAKWVKLIDRFPESQTIFLLGAPGDREACEAIRRSARHPKVVNKAGELSLLESAALMQHARMNYANDSAPVHLASAMDAPITAVFCSTIPAFGFGPLSSNSRIVETHHELACRPCGLHGYRECPEGHFRCAEIEVSKLGVR